MGQNFTVKYKPEIDGLRAIAVLAVVIYHAQFGSANTFLLSGGYIGVDVFFVISGFLITSIILTGLNTTGFGFIDFYERRARRILPALFTVISVSIPFAWWLMLPQALQEYAGSVLSSIFFGSNFWFWQQDSYTAEPSLLKPFLHTWSLSVEEQFYLLFPSLLIVIWKFAKPHLLLIISVVLLLSLFLAQWSSDQYTDANFYLLPTRLWELGGGAILAVWSSPSQRNRFDFPNIAKEVCQVIGIGLLVLSFIFFDHDTRHPSLITLFPIVGTMLLIWAAHPGLWMTRLLSAKPLVHIGKWSYSFYLWHFPVFAFARIHGFAESHIHKLSLIAVSLGLACLTYYWIEQPSRRKERIQTSTFLRYIGVWFVLLVACMTAFYMSGGAPQRLGVVRDLFDSAKIIEVQKHGQNCHQRLTENACYFSGKKDKPVLVNVGDSHAKALGAELKKVAEKFGFAYLQLSADSCPLVRNAYSMIDHKLNNNCHPASQEKRMAMIKRIKNSIIVVSSRYPLYLSSEGFDNKEGGKESIPRIWISDQAHKENDVSVSSSLIQSTFNELLDTNAQVVMVYPVPETGWDIPKHVRKQLNSHPASQKLKAFESMQISTSYDVYIERTASSFKILNGVADRPNLARIFPSEVLCRKSSRRCFTHNQKALFYHDDDHLGPAGAALIGKQIENLLKTKGFEESNKLKLHP